jgi:conjugative relaxase-like TrwC/TraI family protein
MISVRISLSAENAESYYPRDNYYIGSDKPSYGYWHEDDEMSDLFGLTGPVELKSFSKILKGYNPINGAPIAANAGNKRRCAGTDLTFSAPKSASLFAFGDKRVRKAQKKAVRKTLDFAKGFIQTRHKHNGVVTFEKTGRDMFAIFEHDVARAPDSEHEPDPQLHSHCVMPNVTLDADGQPMAIHNPFNNRIIIHLLGQYYRNSLAEELKKLGYQINITNRKKGLFEIKSVSKEIIKTFSKRSDQVKKEVENLRKLTYKDIYETDKAQLMKWATERAGTTDPAAVNAEFERLRNSNELAYANWSKSKLTDLATQKSRQLKKDVKEEDVIDQVNDTLLEKHGETIDSLIAKAKTDPPDLPDPNNTPRKAILAAVENATKTESAYRKEEIIRNAMRLKLGDGDPPEAIIAEFDRLIGTKITELRTETSKWGETTYYSTPELMNIERENIDICLKSKTNYVIDDKIVDEFINNAHKELINKPDGTGFTKGQADALRQILTTKWQFSVVQGNAGTGKSFSMKYAKVLLEQNGYEVCGVAPTGKATDELAAAAGIKTVMTIDSLIKTADKHLEHGKKYCIIVDESSMGGSRTINELLKVTQEYGAKVIFVGDKKQFQPVGAGKFFSDLQKSGVDVTHMKDVVRQKTAQTRNIVKALADKEIPEAFNHLAGYAAISTGYDKTDAPNYNNRQQLLFHEYYRSGTAEIPQGTTAQITGVGRNELTIEYTADGQRIEVRIDPKKAHTNFTAYDRNTEYKNCIKEIKDSDTRQKAVAADYVNCHKAGTDAIVVTATNEDRRNINKIIRETLVNQGKIENIGEFSLLEPQNISDFLSADSFSVGQKVKGLPQLKADGKPVFGVITDIDANKNRITVRNPATQESFQVYTPDYAGKPFSVFNNNEKTALGIGEKIAFLKNAKVTDRHTGETVNLRNGQLATIAALDKEGNISVQMDNKDVKFSLNDYNYLTTAFALSLHKSQGMTVDKVIWHADSQKEVSTNSIYVALTRCKRDIAVYTDDTENLRKKAAIEQDKISTIDGEDFEEEYNTTYKKHLETTQKRKQKDVAPTLTAPEAATSTQETAPTPPPTAPKAAPAVQTVKPRTEYCMMKINGYNPIPRPNEDLRKLSNETIIKLTFPPKDCDTFEAITANIKKMGLKGFFSTNMLNLWKSNFEKKDNAHKAGTQTMRDIIAAARELQANGVSVDRETKQGKAVRSITFKPDNDGCFGLDVVKEVGKDGKPLYTVIMKYPDRNEFARKKELVTSWSKKKLPILRMDGEQVKIVGYDQKNGVDIELNVKTSEWVYKDEKDIFTSIGAALRACIPERIQRIVLSAIRNIKEEKGYSDVPESKTPEKMKSMGFSLTGDD